MVYILSVVTVYCSLWLLGPEGWDANNGAGVAVSGRYIFSLWRILRKELKLPMYTYQYVVEEGVFWCVCWSLCCTLCLISSQPFYCLVLKCRVPFFSDFQIFEWISCVEDIKQHRALEYVLNKTIGNLQILEKLDIFLRSAEMCQLFGTDFYSIFLR